MAIRSLGRPQIRWENDVKNDLNIMKIYNWKDCIQDRHKWKKKSLRRPKHSMNEVVGPEEDDMVIFAKKNYSTRIRRC
jgi:hypothetical protein